MGRKRQRKSAAQSKRFIDAAREGRGADETEEGADRAFKKIVRPPAKTKSEA